MEESKPPIFVEKAVIVTTTEASRTRHFRAKIALALIVGIVANRLYDFCKKEPTAEQPIVSERCQPVRDYSLVSHYWNTIKGLLLNFLKITIETLNVEDLSLSGSANLGEQINLSTICRANHIDIVECYYGSRSALEELKGLNELIENILRENSNITAPEKVRLEFMRNRIAIYIAKLEPALDDLNRNLLLHLCPRPRPCSNRETPSSTTRTLSQPASSDTHCSSNGCQTVYHYNQPARAIR